jgi:hypothetical protein
MKMLKEFGILSLVAVEVPKLEPLHIAKRFRFAQTHQEKD